MTTPRRKTCYRTLSWWGGEYEGNCELPQDHGGEIHWDGSYWYDEEHEEVYDPPSELELLAAQVEREYTLDGEERNWKRLTENASGLGPGSRRWPALPLS